MGKGIILFCLLGEPFLSMKTGGTESYDFAHEFSKFFGTATMYVLAVRKFR